MTRIPRKQSEMIEDELEVRLVKLDKVRANLAKMPEDSHKRRAAEAREKMLDEQADQVIAWRDQMRELEWDSIEDPHGWDQMQHNATNNGDRTRLMQVFRTRQAKWKQEDKRFKREVGG